MGVPGLGEMRNGRDEQQIHPDRFAFGPSMDRDGFRKTAPLPIRDAGLIPGQIVPVSFGEQPG